MIIVKMVEQKSSLKITLILHLQEFFPPLYLFIFQYQVVVVDEQKEIKENKLALAASSAITAAAALGTI
jgi:hypothetical protein